jgi:glutamyl/glutaminyl-tRNA synthetase
MAPRFLHHPLVTHPDGRKLSKSAGDTGIRELRAFGATPDAVLGRAAQLGGLPHDGSPIAVTELKLLFR